LSPENADAAAKRNHKLGPLLREVKYGLITLAQLLEHLVRDRKVDEGLLDGKVGCIVEAIDRHLFSRSLAFPHLLTILFFFSVCKQRDALKDLTTIKDILQELERGEEVRTFLFFCV